VPFPHHFDQQAVRCDSRQVPPLSAWVYDNAVTHLHNSLIAEAACFYSILLNQILSICHSIQHPLWLAALSAAHVAYAGFAAGVGDTHRHVTAVLADLPSCCTGLLVCVLLSAAVGHAVVLHVVNCRYPCLHSLQAVPPARAPHPSAADTPAASLPLVGTFACRKPQEGMH
jgi:hypothetical protein